MCGTTDYIIEHRTYQDMSWSSHHRGRERGRNHCHIAPSRNTWSSEPHTLQPANIYLFGNICKAHCTQVKNLFKGTNNI